RAHTTRLPLHTCRLPAVPWSTHPEHPRGSRLRDDSHSMRVLRTGRAFAAVEHRAIGAAQSESKAADRGRAADHVRQQVEPFASGCRGGEGVFRRPGLYECDSTECETGRGAELREAHRGLRCTFGWFTELLGVGAW